MATKAEVLGRIRTVPATPRMARPKFFQSLRDWASKTQMGSSASVNVGRHTGARI